MNEPHFCLIKRVAIRKIVRQECFAYLRIRNDLPNSNLLHTKILFIDQDILISVPFECKKVVVKMHQASNASGVY